MQFKASVKKELTYFIRSGKIFIIFFVPIAAMILMMFLYSFSAQVVNEGGLDINTSGYFENVDLTEEELAILENADLMAETFTPGPMFATMMSMAMIVIILLSTLSLMGASGKEQKEKAHIIPNASGLRSINYVSAKFLIYPIFTFITTFVCGLIIGVLAIELFPSALENYLIGFNIDLIGVVVYSLSIALFVMFLTCVSFTIGLSSSMPGVGALSAIIGSYLMSMIFQQFKLDSFQPFALSSLAGRYIRYEDVSFELIITAIITIAICVVLYLLTIFFLQTKEVKNYEDIPEF